MAKSEESISPKRLLQLARSAIQCRVEGEEPPASPENTPAAGDPVASFVTLKIHGKLRGCIGTLEPVHPLGISIQKNAVSAAFHDSRFSPLTRDELSVVTIDISILSEPAILVYIDGEDLRSKLRPDVDGVILRHKQYGATFLPQVWSQLPTVDIFLGQLCLKAGLPEDFWVDGHPEILIYQVQHFTEDDYERTDSA